MFHWTKGLCSFIELVAGNVEQLGGDGLGTADLMFGAADFRLGNVSLSLSTVKLPHLLLTFELFYLQVLNSRFAHEFLL